MREIRCKARAQGRWHRRKDDQRETSADIWREMSRPARLDSPLFSRVGLGHKNDSDAREGVRIVSLYVQRRGRRHPDYIWL
jgi:hypothetical protein